MGICCGGEWEPRGRLILIKEGFIDQGSELEAGGRQAGRQAGR